MGIEVLPKRQGKRRRTSIRGGSPLIMIQRISILLRIAALPQIVFSGLVDEIAGLTLAQVAELGAIIMKRKGMMEPPLIGVMKPGLAAVASKAAAATATKEEKKKPQKTVFELKLESYEASAKIKIIKEVRTFTDLGLKEAKELVEKAPAVLKGGVSKEEAEQIIEKMKGLGAKVVME